MPAAQAVSFLQSDETVKSPKKKVPAHGRPDGRVYLAVFLALAMATCVAAYRSYASRRLMHRERVHVQLEQIAKLKANEVAAWRLERIGDATVAATDARLMPAMDKVLRGTADTQVRSEVLGWMDAMRTNYQYVNVMLLGKDGDILLASGKALGTIEFYREFGRAAEEQAGVVFREVPQDEQSTRAHMTLGICLTEGGGEPRGSLLLEVDPWIHFYPVILAWPSAGKTGETMLVKRAGDEIVYLSEVRDLPGAAMKLRVRLEQTENPAVQAARGKEGAVDGREAAGREILGAAARVPNSDWYVLAQRDLNEVNADLESEIHRIAATFGLLVMTCGCGIYLIWRMQLDGYYRQKVKDEREKLTLTRHYENLMRYANEAVFLLDKWGRILEANDRATEIYGYSHEELLGKNVRELRTEDVQSTFESVWREVQEKKGMVFEVRNRRRDGTSFFAEVSIRALEVAGQHLCQSIVRDVTQRKRAEEALRESKERFEALFEHAGIGIALVDVHGRPIKSNPALESIVGYSAAELREMVFTAITHTDDRELDWGLYQELIAGQRQSYQIEKRYIRKDGAIVWGLLTVSLIRDEHGQPWYSVGMLEDMTARKKLEEQFWQSQKLEGIGKLAGGVAHDFNNLLTVIVGYCEVLLNRMKKEDANHKSIEEIRKAGEKATSLTQQLLAFSRRQVIQPRALHLNAVVADSEKFFARLLGEDVLLRAELRAKQDEVMADVSQLNQVLMNLLVNARDAMPKGGTLTLETENAELREAGNPEEPAGKYVVLTVSDTGTGMDGETRKHVFEPFFTTKAQGKGTGLGLSTVYGIVRQSGGIIRLESVEGAGTTFRILLPLTEERVEAPIAAPVKRPLQGKEAILVVEDQENVRTLAVETLKEYGYAVLAAANAQEALQICGEYRGRIDLLVTDVVMPGMDGKELAEKVRQQRREVKALFVSGYSSEVISRRGVLDSGLEYLPKPFGPAALAAKVREVLGEPKHHTILVVDDEEGVRHLFEELLGNKYRVLLASDGRQALQIMDDAQDVDLVITDLVMPNKEGIETIREMRRKYAGMRIIAMSGAFDGQFLRTAQLLGADATLTKPIQPRVLYERVGEALN